MPIPTAVPLQRQRRSTGWSRKSARRATTTFFVDANVFVYAAARDPRRAACEDVLGAIARGESDGRTSASVLEEVWHVELRGRGEVPRGYTARSVEASAPLLTVTGEVFAAALALPDSALGANDRVHAATCIVHEIATIVTADRGFDTVEELRRVDPGDADGVARLLAA